MLQGKQTMNHPILLSKLSLNISLSVLLNSGYPFVKCQEDLSPKYWNMICVHWGMVFVFQGTISI